MVLDLDGLASRLKDLRGDRTYEQIAELTGVSGAQYFRLEKKQKPNVSANLLLLLARKLGVTLTYLVEGPTARAGYEPGAFGVAQPGAALEEFVRQVIRKETERTVPGKNDAPANKSKVSSKNRR